MSNRVVTEFTIDRKTWWRGQGVCGSKLVLDNGMMCCLGHYGLACGVKAEDMLNLAEPCNLLREERPFPSDMEWLVEDNATDEEEENVHSLDNSPEATDLISANDCKDVDSKWREKRITELFAVQGITVKFIN